MPTELWIAACIVCTAVGMAIAYADAARWNRKRAPQAQSDRRVSTPNQELLADVWQQQEAA